MRETSEGARERTEQFLSFTIGATDFGVPILKVKEILQYEEVTALPGAPPSVRGVTNVRGAAVPVVDLGVRLGQARAAPTARSCVLVVEVAGEGGALTLGVFADAVNEVVDLRAADVEPPPDLGAGVQIDHLVGVGKAGKGFVLLLDLDRLLAGDEAPATAA